LQRDRRLPVQHNTRPTLKANLHIYSKTNSGHVTRHISCKGRAGCCKTRQRVGDPGSVNGGAPLRHDGTQDQYYIPPLSLYLSLSLSLCNKTSPFFRSAHSREYESSAQSSMELLNYTRVGFSPCTSAALVGHSVAYFPHILCKQSAKFNHWLTSPLKMEALFSNAF
jgi:hypothetical protein